MRVPERRARAPRRSAPYTELQGHLAGLEHALELARRSGEANPTLASALVGARAALARGERREAERLLEEVARALEAGQQESELTEFPRGLVDYVPKGERGRPPSEEEDALQNRQRLVLHLADLAPLLPEERAAVQRDLEEARAALARPDRNRARELIDRAHRRVEASAERRR
jgi:hypothetical protein